MEGSVSELLPIRVSEPATYFLGVNIELISFPSRDAYLIDPALLFPLISHLANPDFEVSCVVTMLLSL